MTPQPELTTDRLLLRPFQLEDAPRVQELAGDWEIAKVTANVPHPYEDGMAEGWINGHPEAFETGTSASFAVTLNPDGLLIGAVGLHIAKRHHRARNRLLDWGALLGPGLLHRGRPCHPQVRI